MRNLKFVIVPIAALTLLACDRKDENPQPSSNSGTEAFPGQRGELKEGTFLGMRIKYKQIGERKVFDGDILLSDNQLAAQPNARTQGAAVTGYEEGGLPSGARWPGNVVYYVFDDGFANEAAVTTAMARIESQTNVRFVLRTTEPNYVNIRNPEAGEGNAANVGMVGGAQILTLTANSNAGSAIHELGHAIGLLHEHNRSDRDDYLDVNLNNANPDYHYAYNIYDNLSGFDYGEFDFYSVMLYSSLDFSINGEPVLTLKNGESFTNTNDSPDAVLSEGDVSLINAMYPAWANLPGTATDIGVGGPNGTVCVIGPGGVVFRRNSANTAWVSLYRTGTRIDVGPSGAPWIVNSANEIYRFNGSSWVLVPGEAQDIGIGANGSIYIVRPDVQTDPDRSQVQMWNGSGWTSLGREAYRVTADPDGNAWITDYDGNISKYNLASGVWEDIVAPDGFTDDIGAGASGVFVVNIDGEIMKLGNNKWFRVNGSASAIDGGASGAAVVSGGVIYSF